MVMTTVRLTVFILTLLSSSDARASAISVTLRGTVSALDLQEGDFFSWLFAAFETNPRLTSCV